MPLLNIMALNQICPPDVIVTYGLNKAVGKLSPRPLVNPHL